MTDAEETTNLDCWQDAVLAAANAHYKLITDHPDEKGSYGTRYDHYQKLVPKFAPCTACQPAPLDFDIDEGPADPLLDAAHTFCEALLGLPDQGAVLHTCQKLADAVDHGIGLIARGGRWCRDGPGGPHQGNGRSGAHQGIEAARGEPCQQVEAELVEAAVGHAALPWSEGGGLEGGRTVAERGAGAPVRGAGPVDPPPRCGGRVAGSRAQGEQTTWTT